jgi:hypothetical protein
MTLSRVINGILLYEAVISTKKNANQKFGIKKSCSSKINVILFFDIEFFKYFFQVLHEVSIGIFIFHGGNKRLRNVTKLYCQCQISHKRRKKECLGKFKFSLIILKK